MPKIFYSWRLKREVPLLTDEEYLPIGRLLTERILEMKAFRRESGKPLSDPRVTQAGLDKLHEAINLYKEMTGVRLDYPDQLEAIRQSLYGALCPECSKPFRTPKAKICMECGHSLPDNIVAGPLLS